MLIQNVRKRAGGAKPGGPERTERRRRGLVVRPQDGEGPVEVGVVPVARDTHQQRKIVDYAVGRPESAAGYQRCLAENSRGEADRRPDSSCSARRTALPVRTRSMSSFLASNFDAKVLPRSVDDHVSGVRHPDGRPALERLDRAGTGDRDCSSSSSPRIKTNSVSAISISRLRFAGRADAMFRAVDRRAADRQKEATTLAVSSSDALSDTTKVKSR